MKVAFTICSNNYLAHAKTLGDSFLKYHPDFTFVIGLVDQASEKFDYQFFSNFTLIPVADLQIGNLGELVAKYNITELNTAVKPSYFHYLFQKYNADKIFYVDPDILVFGRFDEAIDALDKMDIVLTPHIMVPIDDDYAPTDFHTLRGGVFNLGFLGLAHYHNLIGMLNWWRDRVIKYGYSDFSKNMFYDQVWMNYIPCFYDDYFVIKNPGYNMANWNLHERFLNKDENGEFVVNGKFPLSFFHFSGYHFQHPESICIYHTRYDFVNRPDLKPVFDYYHSLLYANKVEEISKLEVKFYPDLNKKQEPEAVVRKSIPQRAFIRLRRTIKVFVSGNP